MNPIMVTKAARSETMRKLAKKGLGCAWKGILALGGIGFLLYGSRELFNKVADPETRIKTLGELVAPAWDALENNVFEFTDSLQDEASGYINEKSEEILDTAVMHIVAPLIEDNFNTIRPKFDFAQPEYYEFQPQNPKLTEQSIYFFSDVKTEVYFLKRDMYPAIEFTLTEDTFICDPFCREYPEGTYFGPDSINNTKGKMPLIIQSEVKNMKAFPVVRVQSEETRDFPVKITIKPDEYNTLVNQELTPDELEDELESIVAQKLKYFDTEVAKLGPNPKDKEIEDFRDQMISQAIYVEDPNSTIEYKSHSVETLIWVGDTQIGFQIPFIQPNQVEYTNNFWNLFNTICLGQCKPGDAVAASTIFQYFPYYFRDQYNGVMEHRIENGMAPKAYAGPTDLFEISMDAVEFNGPGLDRMNIFADEAQDAVSSTIGSYGATINPATFLHASCDIPGDNLNNMGPCEPTLTELVFCAPAPLVPDLNSVVNSREVQFPSYDNVSVKSQTNCRLDYPIEFPK